MIGVRLLPGIARRGCGAFGPGAVASRGPGHGVTGAGKAKRRRPIGGAANGTPRNRATPPADRPRTRPAGVATSTSETSTTPEKARPRPLSDLGNSFAMADVLPTLRWPRERGGRATLR